MGDVLHQNYYAANDYRMYLMHYGIKGMHWGVRRYQNPDGSLTELGYKHYGRKNLQDAYAKNLDKWGKDKDHNVLYVTGQSGSGKSTIAKAANGKNTNRIHLDIYISTNKDKANRDADFNKFLESKGKDPGFVRYAKDGTKEEFGKALYEFEEYIEEFGRQQYGKKKVVVEGVQLLDDTIRPDKSFFKDKPIIVNKPNTLKSMTRAMIRDWEEHGSPKQFFKYADKRLDHYRNSEKQIKKLDKEVNLERAKKNTNDILTGDTVFISGSSKTQDKQSGYFRKKLPKDVAAKIDEMIEMNDKIIVGDAPGIDRQVQNYLKSRHYNNVEIYGPGKDKVRYLANPKWKTNLIDSKYEPGSSKWLAAKDEAMTKAATKGLAVILDQGAMATRRNAQRLIDQGKMADVFQLSLNDISQDRFVSREEINELLKTIEKL